MASSYPEQSRAVDPFASYNSNVVNQLTGIVTRGSDALDYYNSLQITPNDSTSVTALTGFVYKDAMLIEITSEFTVDFTDPNHYVTPPSNPFVGVAGRYYIVLEYEYVKSRPAPKAYIKILTPSQTASFRAGSFPSLFFLKSVDVSLFAGFGQIDNLYDNDPSYTDTRRLYLLDYAGSEIGLPTHTPARDQSRIVYDPEADQFFFGYSDRWGSAGGATIQADTSGFAVGDLVYINSAGNLAAATGAFAITTADGVVTNVGVNGTVKTNGAVEQVTIEPGSSASVGDIVYLSVSNPGTITNQKSTPFWQFVGRVTEVVDSTSVNALFVRGEPSGIEGIELGISSAATLSGGSWVSSGGLVYQDIDISGFDGQKVIITIWDVLTEMKIQPEDIEFVSDSILRIWMPGGYAGTLDCLLIGPSTTTVASGSLAKVTDTLSGGDWNASGPDYYADVDVSAINSSEGAVVICWDDSNDEQVHPAEIQYDSTNVLKIWMPVNTETLNIVAVGPTDVNSIIATMTVSLASGGSWNADGALYYQDVPISSLGTDDVVFDMKDSSSGERVEHTAASVATSGVLRIWMPDNTHALDVTVVG